jgi:outer membrane protein insertion porin family
VSGEVPFWEQFFVGGIGYGGVRYARFLSGDNAYEDPFVTSSQALRGYTEGRFWGRNMLVGSVEYRYPIGEGTRLVAFSDVGDAWNNDVKVLDPYQIDPDEQDGTFKAHASVGLGLRVATPIGAFRVDCGVGSEGSRTDVSIGQVF